MSEEDAGTTLESSGSEDIDDEIFEISRKISCDDQDNYRNRRRGGIIAGQVPPDHRINTYRNT